MRGVSKEKAGDVGEGFVKFGEGILGGVFSRRIGVARPGESFSATGG